MGRFGELLAIVRKGKQMAEKNGNDPWVFNFREAWFRTLVYDFEGARRLCEVIMRPGAEYPTSQPMAIARIAAGYAELDCGNYDQAIEYFTQVIDPAVTPKFFLHWAWRMTAQLGLSNVALKSGDIVNARIEADAFLKSALHAADPHLQVQAWGVNARVAIVENDWTDASECVRQGLAILERFDVPVVAWQIHALAHQLSRHHGNDNLAEKHGACALSFIFRIADSFPPDEPLRQIFVNALPVATVLGSPMPARASHRPASHCAK
jgi:hypothetical protein